MYTIKVIQTGRIGYKEAWDLQKKLHAEVYQNRGNPPLTADGAISAGYLLLVEHPHVYTLGKSGNANNLLVDPAFLQSIDATYVQTDRGGDITYHGPGQIVGYPIIDLELLKTSVKQYIWDLEEVIIKTLARYGLEGMRVEGATGVWLGYPGSTRQNKICAFGVKVSHGITMHGWALNVGTNLKYFTYINPCGFTDKGVTSLEVELSRKLTWDETQGVLVEQFSKVFPVKPEE